MKGIIGAICGDIIGSSREFRPIKTKDFKLFDGYSCFTDDTVMTLAIASWLIKDKNSKDILISEIKDSDLNILMRVMVECLWNGYRRIILKLMGAGLMGLQ